MELKVFSIFDSKMTTFQMPYFKLTLGATLRDFEDLVNDPKTMAYNHSEDFQLYEIGTWDDQTALFTPKTPLTMVAAATEYKKDLQAKKLSKLAEA